MRALRPKRGGPRHSIPSGDHPRSGEANIYFSLQALQPDLGGDGRNRLVRARSTAKDADAHAYTLFVVDVDPERNPKDSSSSDAEKAEAGKVADAVKAWLQEKGVRPILADSGNGWHLLVPLVPATGDDLGQAATDAHDLLKLLDARFSTPAAKVDTTTYNPSRILKLYGTRAVKGEDTPDRPHRLSSVVLGDVPPDIDLFALVADDLAAFRAAAPKPTPAPSASSSRKSSAAPSNEPSPAWRSWRDDALGRLPIEAIYGPWLTGKSSGAGWLQCRDPESASGDQNPSAGVADGTGQAERASFHSFLTTTMTVRRPGTCFRTSNRQSSANTVLPPPVTTSTTPFIPFFFHSSRARSCQILGSYFRIGVSWVSSTAYAHLPCAA